MFFRVNHLFLPLYYLLTPNFQANPATLLLGARQGLHCPTSLRGASAPPSLVALELHKDTLANEVMNERIKRTLKVYAVAGH